MGDGLAIGLDEAEAAEARLRTGVKYRQSGRVDLIMLGRNIANRPNLVSIILIETISQVPTTSGLSLVSYYLYSLKKYLVSNPLPTALGEESTARKTRSGPNTRPRIRHATRSSTATPRAALAVIRIMRISIVNINALGSAISHDTSDFACIISAEYTPGCAIIIIQILTWTTINRFASQ